MTESSKLVVVIAAGGTAGHIRPALAVGEALRARGATVTFAGSPDRVESRLVPEAGFELDTFAISGFPRKPSVALLDGALAGREGTVRLPGDPEAAAARRRPRRRRLRRRADGARGRALSAHPCGAHRGRRAPRAREPAGRAVRVEALPRLRDPGPRRRRRSRSSGARSRSPTSARAATTLARASGSPPRTRSSPSSARSPERTSLNEMAVAAWGDAGPTVLHVSGERDFADAAPARRRARTTS